MLAAESTELSSSATASERPFYFIVILWGERFRNYFLEFCLASLLSPGNIPALEPSRRSKFLIATRPEDWSAMAGTEIFRTLKRYVEPVFVEIPPCPPGRSGYKHMGVGHGLTCAMAHRDKAYAVLLTPDCMLSDGSVTRLAELARSGTELVLTAALRFGEEPFMAHLETMGALPKLSRGASGTSLNITGRQMAFAAVNGFHSQTLTYEWDAPGLLMISPAAWWRVPGEDGIVLHCLSWAPILLDYGAIGEHDMSTFDQWTLDGDYLFNNSRNMTRIHVVQDSDELFLASWGPLADGATTKTRFPFDKYIGGYFFKMSFYSGFFDPLKRAFFFRPVRWHAKPLNERWTEVEQRAMAALGRWVAPPQEEGSIAVNFSANPLRWLSIRTRRMGGAALRSVAYAWIFRNRIGFYLRGLLRGDRAAMARIVWFVRSFVFDRS